MQKPTRILLYYDGSPEARSALHRAADLALALGAHADVLAVVDTGSTMSVGEWYLSDIAFGKVRHAMMGALKEALDHMTGFGIAAQGHMAFGTVVDSISRHAGMLDADMLVIGHRTRGRLARWLGGSTHAELVERCKGRTVVTIACD
jgi:nucleotide-binding universal stress UspA family protein